MQETIEREFPAERSFLDEVHSVLHVTNYLTEENLTNGACLLQSTDLMMMMMMQA